VVENAWFNDYDVIISVSICVWPKGTTTMQLSGAYYQNTSHQRFEAGFSPRDLHEFLFLRHAAVNLFLLRSD
jgi:hypothetical protein